jgi:hypothetical protein
MDVPPALTRSLVEQGLTGPTLDLSDFQRRISRDHSYIAQYGAGGQITGYVRCSEQGRKFDYFDTSGKLLRSRTTSNNVTIWRDAEGRVTGGSEAGLEAPALSPIDIVGPPAATLAKQTGAFVLKKAATKVAQVRLSRALVAAGETAPKIVLPSSVPTVELAGGRFLLSRPSQPNTPTVIAAREVDDWNGAFWNKDYHVLQARPMRVPLGPDQKPIDLGATGVLMGHGAPDGIAHVTTREAAVLIVDAAEQQGLRNVVLHSCSQSTLRSGLYGSTHAKALQAEVNTVLAERGIAKPISLYAAHRPGVTYGLLEVEGLDGVRRQAVYLPADLQTPVLSMSRAELKLSYDAMPAGVRSKIAYGAIALGLGTEVALGWYLLSALQKKQ